MILKLMSFCLGMLMGYLLIRFYDTFVDPQCYYNSLVRESTKTLSKELNEHLFNADEKDKEIKRLTEELKESVRLNYLCRDNHSQYELNKKSSKNYEHQELNKVYNKLYDFKDKVTKMLGDKEKEIKELKSKKNK